MKRRTKTQLVMSAPWGSRIGTMATPEAAIRRAQFRVGDVVWTHRRKRDNSTPTDLLRYNVEADAYEVRLERVQIVAIDSHKARSGASGFVACYMVSPQQRDGSFSKRTYRAYSGHMLSERLLARTGGMTLNETLDEAMGSPATRVLRAPLASSIIRANILWRVR